VANRGRFFVFALAFASAKGARKLLTSNHLAATPSRWTLGMDPAFEGAKAMVKMNKERWNRICLVEAYSFRRHWGLRTWLTSQ
jgi:hypothetical protein